MTAMETATLPLMAGQTDIWFDERFSGSSPAYNAAVRLDIRGPLDQTVFEAAVRRLIEEAECTRIRFVEVDGLPRQVVEPLTTMPLTWHDLTAEPNPEDAALAWMNADLVRPFDLTEFPLFRLAVLRLGDDRSQFYMAIHHSISDGYSHVIYWKRLADIYSALVSGGSVEDGALPPLHLLVEAETAYDESRFAERDRQYWMRRFPKAPETCTLSNRSPVDSLPQEFLRRSVMLGEQTTEKLREVSQQAGVTTSALVMAATAVYTNRLTGAGEVLLTVAASTRMSAQTRAIPGMTANFLPLQVSVDREMTRSELLSQTSRELLGILKHQRYRIGAIRRDMGLRTDDRWPFGPFVNILPLQTEMSMGPCAVTVHNISTGLISDLMVTSVDVAAKGVLLHVNGNPDLYSAEEVEDHLARFAGVLDRFVNLDENAPLGRLELLGADESRQWQDMSSGPVRPDGYQGVVERIREIAVRRPDATAVVEGASGAPAKVTYADLVGRASALSRRLADADLVGVLAAPGAGFIAAVLGTWGAGAAYVPLDTHVSPARVAGMLAENGIHRLVVDAEHRALAGEVVEAVGERAEIDVVVLDAAEDAPGDLAPVAGGPDDLAYVIFTSGSTGKPKGAMVHRAGMVNHLLAKVDDLGLTASDSVIQNAPLTFDISVWQMLAALITGGHVRVVPRETTLDPNLLFPVAGSEGVTILEVVPSLLRAGLDSWDTTGDSLDLASLRWLVVTGEAMPPDLCRRWFERFPRIPLMNAYGPTECSDDVTHALITGDDAFDSGRTPIGRAVRNTRLYVLGDDLTPVPRGVIGELYVGGAGVGRGYLRDHVRTATMFVPDPFAGPGKRMYRTGDRVVWRLDGQLEFVERRDHQVKVRGHRIELGEIEATMRALPDVRDAAAVVLGDQNGNKRLAGYLVPGKGTSLDTAEVRERLAEVLPEYMVPSALMVLDDMPLTTHGKVDRDALPEPTFSGTSGGRAPRTREEELFCHVLADVLGVETIGTDDNFFALGGDSISSIQVASRARRQGVLITPQQIFRLKTPAAIAAAARPVDGRAQTGATDGVGEVELLPVSQQLREDLALLSTSGMPAAAREYNQFVVVDVPSGMDVDRLTRAVQGVVDHHDSLRMRLSVPTVGMWMLEALPQGAIRAENVVRRAEASISDDAAMEDFVAEQAAEARSRLEPENGLVTQVVLLDAGADRPARLLWLVHHLCVDGVSWRVLVPDLREAWEALASGRDVSLEPVGTSYRRWARMLGEQASTTGRLAEFPTWMAQVREPEPALAARPLDPLVDTYATAHSLRLVLPPEYAKPLLTAAPAVFGGEVNDVLLTGLALAMADWRRRKGTEHSRVRIELEGHGREPFSEDDDLDLARTVGWFTTIFPVQLDLAELDWDEAWAAGPAMGSAIERVRDQLHALPARGLGYGLLRYLNPQTQPALARFAPPELGFNYLGWFSAGGGAGEWSLDGGNSVVSTGVSPDMPLRHVLAVTPVTEDRPDGPHLVADWLWGSELFRDEDAQDIARTWFQALRALVAHAGAKSAASGNAGDFPGLRQLDRTTSAEGKS